MIYFYVHWCFVCVRVKSAGVIGSCELSCRFWQLNLGSLEEQPMILPLSYLSRPLAEFSKLMAPSYLFSANSIWLPWNQAVCLKPYQFNMFLYFRSAHNFIHSTLSPVLYPTKVFQSKIRPTNISRKGVLSIFFTSKNKHLGLCSKTFPNVPLWGLKKNKVHAWGCTPLTPALRVQVLHGLHSEL